MSARTGTIHIYTDGGARGNPGPAAVGAVLTDGSGKVQAEISKFIGHATNNVAEYLAVIYALHEAIRRKTAHVVLHLDSQLVARQLKGEYRVKDQNLKKFCDLILDLFGLFDKIEIKEIGREENKAADRLVNSALDSNDLLR